MRVVDEGQQAEPWAPCICGAGAQVEGIEESTTKKAADERKQETAAEDSAALMALALFATVARWQADELAGAEALADANPSRAWSMVSDVEAAMRRIQGDMAGIIATSLHSEQIYDLCARLRISCATHCGPSAEDGSGPAGSR
jgi:hypothetical protein